MTTISTLEIDPQPRVFELPVELASADVRWIGPTVPSKDQIAFFAPQARTSAIYSYHIPQAVVATPGMYVFQQGKLVANTATFNAESPIGGLPADTRPTQLPVHAILGATPNYKAYLHWCTQCLPAIDWALTCDQGREPYLALPPLEKWQEDMLALLGHDAVPRMTLTDAGFFQFESCEYNTLLDSRTPFQVSGCVAHTMKKLACAVPNLAVNHERVYVYNADSYYGMLENEFDVMDFFRSRGYHLLIPDLSNVVEQIQIFRSARLVVGPHGNTMANIAFCETGATAWELFPEHYVNACNNRLAQGAGLSYRSSLFSSAQPRGSGRWRIDLNAIARMCEEVEADLAREPNSPSWAPYFGIATHKRDSWGQLCSSVLPLNELLMKFESLGEDCEFGLVQRDGGAEPLGLFRFAGFYVPWKDRLDHLIDAIESKLDGLGDHGSLSVKLAGEPGRREYMVTETTYNLLYHTFRHEDDVSQEDLEKEQYRVLRFLRRKFFEDLGSAEKIWLFKSRVPNSVCAVERLAASLRQHGPNRLLWVSYADADNLPGTITRLNEYLIHGYVAPPKDGQVVNFLAQPWYQVCRQANDMFFPSVPHRDFPFAPWAASGPGR